MAQAQGPELGSGLDLNGSNWARPTLDCKWALDRPRVTDHFFTHESIGDEIFDVVDDGDVERTARASSDLFADLEVFFGDLEQVSAGTRVCVRLKLVVPFHVFDLHIVVRHLESDSSF
ncbi:hypothetical protein HYC85_009126 [Camellia sinensis]|uniref:Uncharacterized protein n=1 Tax=Camellia sinensis TaxID=4442 RepID=A0A7J7HE47_CAMSI|nr:hypothetical protein HYC85_009126 [Camellia sinensis]